MSCDPPVGGSIQSHSPKAALIGINRVSGFPEGARILARRQSSQFGAERIDAALGTPRRIPLHGLAAPAFVRHVIPFVYGWFCNGPYTG